MTDNRPKLVIITGPTASGKSSLAVDLALDFGGEIVNADSMQIYRGMDIGTAKPSISERRGVPHHLIDVVDPDEEFNASIYRSFAEPLLKEIAARRKVCFVVGGTGLYIKTLLGGLLECPPFDPKLREELSRGCEEQSSIQLHERLKILDPESAIKIHPHDKMRIIRALEIIKLTNRTLSSLIQKHAFKEMSFRALKICLYMERKQLYQRINARSLAMIEAGLVEETQSLLDNGYSPELNAMRSLGYRHVMRYIEGGWDLDEAIRQLQTDTRRYAKRQLTWFRGDPEMVWVKPEDRDLINKEIREFI
ncbi:MAG: tRNA (adenosine(37)-N6)-dimethylallyltransferase MiaA [Deltaproteobacteria bacterium]|nr:tRNA (adenosine(37)-N6)-dimethylallyltransferase MiaA [Deltaproteobacteria bacterium]